MFFISLSSIKGAYHYGYIVGSYYLTGTINGVDCGVTNVDPDMLFLRDTGDQMILSHVVFKQGDVVKAARYNGANTFTIYPDGVGREIVIDKDGVYDIFFKPYEIGNPNYWFITPAFVEEITTTLLGDVDDDVIIPDTVPADYPVSSLRGKTVIAVDGNAFKDKTFITSVTAGDTLAHIYDSAFEGCTSLETVTIGSGLDSIGTVAFKGCTALQSFTSSSLQDITFSHNTDDPEHPQQSFDIGAEVVFRGPHSSKLLEVADYYDTVFSPTDRHVDPVWTWTADYCSATATFACSDCQLDGDEHPAAITLDGTVYTATVTVDGEDYTDTVNVSETAVAKIAPDHYYADFRSAIVAAHDDYNDAIIELLKDTTLSWDLELCQNYTPFRVKMNGHSIDSLTTSLLCDLQHRRYRRDRHLFRRKLPRC